MHNKTHHFNNSHIITPEPFFSIPRKPRILSRNNDENKVPPAPQIIITDHTRSYSSLQSKPPPPLSSDNDSNNNYNQPFLSPKTPVLLTAPGVDSSKRSRSFSPGEASSSSNRSYIMPPAAASLRIDVKSPRNIRAKRKEWLIGKQSLIREKTKELLRKLEEFKFLRERNISLNKEMQETLLFRNRTAISEKLKADYGMLNGVLFDLLKAGERLRGEWGRTAGFRMLTERFEMGKRRNEGLEERIKDIRAKYLKLKFYEELMVINFAIQKEDEKRRLMFLNMKK